MWSCFKYRNRTDTVIRKIFLSLYLALFPGAPLVAQNNLLGRTTIAEHFDHDDHNSPAIFTYTDYYLDVVGVVV